MSQEEAPAELLDLSMLETLSMLGNRRGKDLLGQLFGLYLEQGPEGFAKMRTALAAGRSTDLKGVAHSLKGSYRSLGTPRLAAISKELEDKGSAGDLQGCDVLLDQLEQAFEETTVALRELLVSKGHSVDG